MSATPPPRPSRRGRVEQVVRAMYDYTAQNPDELSFKEGDVLYVIDSQTNTDWWKCKTATTKIEGLIPANYVGENTALIENPLHEAAKRGNIGFAEELLSAGVSVNGLDKAGNSPLHWAARGGHADMIRLLLTKNPAINAQNKVGDTPLHCAAWSGSPESVKLLAEHPDCETHIENVEGKLPIDLAKNDETAAALADYYAAVDGAQDADAYDSDD